MDKFFNKILLKFEEIILSCSVIAMALLLIVGVIFRAAFNNSLTFTEEVATALLILVSFFGLGYCARKGRHITMSIVFDMVGNKSKRIFMIVISLVSAFATTYIGYLAIQYALSVKELQRVTPALQIPMYLIYLVVPIGFILSAIEYMRTFLLNIKDTKNFYLTSEIKVPVSMEIKGDLANLVDKLSEESGER